MEEENFVNSCNLDQLSIEIDSETRNDNYSKKNKSLEWFKTSGIIIMVLAFCIGSVVVLCASIFTATSYKNYINSNFHRGNWFGELRLVFGCFVACPLTLIIFVLGLRNFFKGSKAKKRQKSKERLIAGAIIIVISLIVWFTAEYVGCFFHDIYIRGLGGNIEFASKTVMYYFISGIASYEVICGILFLGLGLIVFIIGLCKFIKGLRENDVCE